MKNSFIILIILFFANSFLINCDDENFMELSSGGKNDSETNNIDGTGIDTVISGNWESVGTGISAASAENIKMRRDYSTARFYIAYRGIAHDNIISVN